jgi:hypothetical protein
MELDSGEEEAWRTERPKEVASPNELSELDTDGTAGVAAKWVDSKASWALPGR